MSPESDSSLSRRIKESASGVLVLGNGIGALAVIRRLARLGIESLVVGSEPDLVRGSRYFRGIPGPQEGPKTSPDAFRRWLDQNRFDRVVLIPCSDNWLLCACELQQAAPERILASISPPETAHRVVDKGLFALFLEDNDIPHPRTVQLRSPADLHAVDDRFLESVFLKPTRSQDFYHSFRRKAVRIGSRSHALEWVTRIQEAGLRAMLQELVPGPPENQVCIDGFMAADGTMGGLFARRWLRKYPDEFGESSLSVSVSLDEVGDAVALVRRAASLLLLRGMFSVELKRDQRDGQYRILEINARSWWWVGFTCDAGVDVCRMTMQDVLGDRVTPVERYRVGGYSAYPSCDWSSYRALPRKRREGLPTLIKRWLTSTQPVFSWRDPGPAWREIRRKVSRRLRRVRARKNQVPPMAGTPPR